ncbi:hypothetical protein NQ317_013127 [Molorchus minor]|uniref:Uncharacterized protein n=1 Tax=Molorchus minor TaxID=1323400 RepID=A0ABQ9JJT7_9CUCU|nr:hypothetical protein NQ317_013127 [Molorchus minor]
MHTILISLDDAYQHTSELNGNRPAELRHGPPCFVIRHSELRQPYSIRTVGISNKYWQSQRFETIYLRTTYFILLVSDKNVSTKCCLFKSAMTTLQVRTDEIMTGALKITNKSFSNDHNDNNTPVY